MRVLPAVRVRLVTALRQLRALYHSATLPVITIAMGRDKPVGIGALGRGIQIGLEAPCTADFLNPNLEDSFVHVISHDVIHSQQLPSAVARDDGHSLDYILAEGIADFIGELISGDVDYSHLRQAVAGREVEFEQRFNLNQATPIRRQASILGAPAPVTAAPQYRWQ